MITANSVTALFFMAGSPHRMAVVWLAFARATVWMRISPYRHATLEPRYPPRFDTWLLVDLESRTMVHPASPLSDRDNQLAKLLSAVEHRSSERYTFISKPRLAANNSGRRSLRRLQKRRCSQFRDRAISTLAHGHWRSPANVPNDRPHRPRADPTALARVESDRVAFLYSSATVQTCNPRMSRVARLDVISASRRSSLEPANAQKPCDFRVGSMRCYPTI